ncbi:MAG: nitrilase-related carbon-nitrogen hydrolase, partial [Planctomycetota bacterium]|nr:nitrilase-related carbon-nitrogen hydrolase [Planctomycetota bacterium]
MTQIKQKIRVAAGVLNQTALDGRGNADRIKSVITDARAKGCQVLCLPELCLTGYGCEDMFLSLSFLKSALDQVGEIAKETAGMLVCVGLPVQYENDTYNAVAVLVDGQLVGIVGKQNLARDGLHYEPRWFRPWPAGKTAVLQVGDAQVPMGDLVFSVGGLRVGFEICEDAWVEDRPLGRLVRRGVQLVLNPSASHFAFGKSKKRQELILAAAGYPGIGYVYSNLLGNEAGRAIYDGDAYLASDGKILKSGTRFSYRESQLTIADLEFGYPESQVHRSNLEPDVHCPDIRWNAMGKDLVLSDVDPGKVLNELKEEEFCRAIALGLFDYVRKSQSQGVVISLSGGADSAAVACLSCLMLEFARNELGVEHLVQRLGFLPLDRPGDSGSPDALKTLKNRMICTAY